MHSITWPGFSSPFAHVEKSPSCTCLMAMRNVDSCWRGADRIRPAKLFARHLRTQRQVLARLKAERIALVVVERKGDDDRLTSFRSSG